MNRQLTSVVAVLFTSRLDQGDPLVLGLPTAAAAGGGGGSAGETATASSTPPETSPSDGAVGTSARGCPTTTAASLTTPGNGETDSGGSSGGGRGEIGTPARLDGTGGRGHQVATTVVAVFGEGCGVGAAATVGTR